MKRFVLLLFSFLFFQSVNAQTERGYAMMIPESVNNNKFVAMHRTLPIGSTIRVMNPSNSNSVEVKIISSLPDTGKNDNVVIKVSSAAFNVLNRGGDGTKKFNVELYY